MISRLKVSFAFFADLGVFALNDGWGPKTRFAEERQGSAKTTKHPEIGTSGESKRTARTSITTMSNSRNRDRIWSPRSRGSKRPLIDPREAQSPSS